MRKEDAMETYVEITWITSVVTICFSTLISFYVVYKPQSIKKMLGYSICISTYACISFFPYAWIGAILLEMVWYRILFRYAIKAWFIMLANRFLFGITCFSIMKGSFYCGIYFVPIEQIPYWYWIGILLLCILLICKWKYGLCQSDFIYHIKLGSSKNNLELKAYLDSGNLLMFQNKPVIFLSEQYQEYFCDCEKQWIKIYQVANKREIPCYLSQVKIGDGQWKSVFVSFSQTLDLPFSCNALLNLNMMTQE